MPPLPVDAPPRDPAGGAPTPSRAEPRGGDVIVGHLDPFSGASGDMLLGAVVDAGADVDAISEQLDGLDLDGWELATQSVTRGGLGATRVRVSAPGDGIVRTWANVRQVLAGARLPEPVRARALATFARLAEAEARIHRRDVEHVHFHEVGAVDAIIDIVGVCAGMAMLDVERLSCGPVAQGIGTTRSDHGVLPVPAPAVLELLRGAPTYSTGMTVELCTPTGAALLAELVDEWRELPRMRIDRVGYGAGARELDQPNVLRLVLGDPVPAPDATAGRLTLLETAVDDLPGELVPPVLDKLRATGALDAWARPVVGKKGRPGLELVCLAPTERLDACRSVLFAETTTLGIRSWPVERHALARESVTVDVAGHPVRLKIGRHDGDVVNVAPEFDDCAAVAAATGLPLKEVFARARAAWRPAAPPGSPVDPPPA